MSFGANCSCLLFLDQMLPRKANWSEQANCDYHAVKKLIERPERPAMITIASEPMRESIFEKRLVRDKKFKEIFDIFFLAYKNLQPNFVICTDNYGGYRLCYKGKNPVFPPQVFRRNPVGFVAQVPDGVVTDLSVMSSERTGQQLLLLGPVRFVNSDCNPNVEYDFSSDYGIVQLRVKRKINPGDEIFVKYGPEFFESNACLCRTCHLQKLQETQFEMIFDDLVADEIHEVLNSLVSQTKKEKVVTPTQRSNPRKRKLRAREIIEKVHELTSSPLSNDESPVQPVRILPFQSNDRNLTNLAHESWSSESEEDLTSSEENTNCSTESDLTTEENMSDFSDANSIPLIKLPTFDSVSSIYPEESVISPAAEESFSPDSFNSSFADSASEKLFQGSKTTVDDAKTITRLFCSRYNLSDECSNSLHSLIKSLLPAENSFPTGYSQLRDSKKTFDENVRVLKNSPNMTFCVMNFRSQLRHIVGKNINQIFEYAEHRVKNPSIDLNCSFCPPVQVDGKKIFFNLILSSDGVNIKKSTLRKELWPIWLQVADLPPRQRMSRQNIVLAVLYVGNKTPPWNELVPHLRSQLLEAIEVRQNDNRYLASFSVKLLVSDLGCKSHMLNMFKFNGYYGCHYCTAQGTTIGKTHSYYPFQQSGQVREPCVNDMFVKYAELLPVDKVVNVVGVKGKSAFADLINGLPITAPIDYMHCVLIGIFPEVLKLCHKALSSEDRIKVKTAVENLSCPREMVAYSRKIRTLEEMGQFKANEQFNWLFYVSPLIFFNRIPTKLYNHLSNLVFGVRLLMESSCDDNTYDSELFLDAFCKEIVSIHEGNERIETINIHSLRHLVDQVRRFGPLFCFSAMSFEAANRTLGDVFSGAHHECEIICRRVLQKHKLANLEIQDNTLRSLFCKLSGNRSYEDNFFSDEFVETKAIKTGRLFYPEAEFFNRQTVNGVYFDSPSYRRSKLGNCYVSFTRNNEIHFGQTQYFMKLKGAPFDDEILANVKLFDLVEEFGPRKGFFFRVKSTEIEKLVPVQQLSKVFLYSELPENSYFIVKLCSTYEHS